MIIGHEKQWQFLKKSVELGKISHAYLFSGQAKLGKKTVALEFIKLICGQEDVFKREHSDLILISPAIGTSIQINQIRELSWKLSLKPFLTPFKVAVIDQAHLMNDEAQNCLLKTLEEPRGNTILILITEYPEILFPTILSRCQIVKFYPVKKIEIENYLRNQGLKEEEIKKISEISQGKPGMATDFLKDLQRLEMRNQQERELVKLLNSDLASRFQYVKTISKTPDLKEILNIWLSYFRNILLAKLKANQKLLTSDVNRLKLIQRIDFLISTTNVNPRLALEIFLLELCPVEEFRKAPAGQNENFKEILHSKFSYGV